MLQQIDKEQKIVNSMVFQLKYDILKFVWRLSSDMDKLLGDRSIYIEEGLSGELITSQALP